ncbi:MAG TPA: RNA pseudouridine synthase [Rectinemataceae bacterium]|nr:RNA pseudouridine synthase [Rectinemataceae bacterium]
MPSHFEIDAEPSVVVADDSVIVVRKPGRMHTAPLPRPESRGPESRESLCDWVFARFPDAATAVDAGRRRPAAEAGLIHRLDYETSGLVLFARTSASLSALLAQQDSGMIAKEYLARTAPSEGFFPEGSRPLRWAPVGIEPSGWEAALREAGLGDAVPAAGLLEVSRAKGALPSIESRFRPYGPGSRRVACLDPGLKAPAAATSESYLSWLVGSLAIGGQLEFRVRLVSGFRHQVRAQLAWIGFPILGDPLYGGLESGRLHLHAARLEFRHPGSGESLVLED